MYLSYFYNSTHYAFSSKKNLISLNFGPQHPAAHGVLRMLVQLKCEYIFKVDIHIGLLHRGTEYLIQSKPYLLNLGYFDRLDYVSMLAQEHGYTLAVENLINTRVSMYTRVTRTLFDELTRILNHLLAVSCHALDLGSMTPLFWAFEERERIMYFYEHISGARMHANFYKPSYNTYECSTKLLVEILHFVSKCYKTLQEISCILINNKVWKHRLINIGLISPMIAFTYSISGVLLRSVGFSRDIRLTRPYSFYNYVDFKSFIGFNGDCYDRFLLRIAEMGESLSIVRTLTLWLLCTPNVRWVYDTKKYSMQALISEFKKWQLGLTLQTGYSTSTIESPKGEFGVYLSSAINSNKPLRCKIRSSSFHHLNLLNTLSLNASLADLIALVGTIDIVFGEIDK